MNREIFMVKGASASGKSTRYLYLIRYLKSIGIEFHEDYFTNENDKTEKVGIYSDELRLYFIGRISDKTGLWRGLDDSLDIFMKVDYLFEFIKDKMDKYSMCIEGSSITRSFRFRPKYFAEFLEADFGIIQYYNFDNVEEFSERKFERSGKVGDNGWHVNGSFINDMKKSVIELKEYSSDIVVYENRFDAPVFDMGVKVLASIGAEFLIDGFIDYCNKNFKI